MATKIIKFNNGTDTYAPVTLASAVQYNTGKDTTPMSVQDAIGTVAQTLIDVANNANGSYMSVSGATDPTVKILTPNGTEKSSYQFKGSGSGSGTSTGHVTVSYDNGVITFGTTYTDTNYYNKIIDKGLSGYQIASITATGTGSSTAIHVPQATSSNLGVVKLGYTDANKGYALKLDKDGKGYVNVPWTDTVPDYSNTYAPKSHVDVKASTTAYGHVKVDDSINGTSTNPVQNKTINTALGGKAASNHTHTLNWTTNPKTTDAGTEIAALVEVPSSATSLGQSSETATFTTYMLPTKKYVDDKIGDIGSALNFKGTVGPNETQTALPTSGVKVGDVWLVKLASGTNSSILSGQTLENGDMIIATNSSPAAWTVVNANWTATDGSQNVTVGGSKVTLATIGGVAIDIQVAQEANVAHMSDFSSYVKTISSNPTTSPNGVITSAVKTGQDIKFTYTNVSSKGTATAATTLSSTAKTITPGWEQNSYGKITSVTGVSIKQDHEGTGAAGKLTYWNSTTSHTAVTTSYGDSTSKYAYVENGVLKEGNLPEGNKEGKNIVAVYSTSTGNENTSPGGSIYFNHIEGGVVKSAHKITGSSGISVNATDASDTGSSISIAHSTGAGYKHIPTGGSANQVLKYSSAGTAVWSSLSEGLKYDIYNSTDDFTLDLGASIGTVSIAKTTF